MAIDVSTPAGRLQLEQQIQALGDVCTCAMTASCRQLMMQLAYQGVLPNKILTMTDEDWLKGCQLARARVLSPVALPSQQ